MRILLSESTRWIIAPSINYVQTIQLYFPRKRVGGKADNWMDFYYHFTLMNLYNINIRRTLPFCVGVQLNIAVKFHFPSRSSLLFTQQILFASELFNEF